MTEWRETSGDQEQPSGAEGFTARADAGGDGSVLEEPPAEDTAPPATPESTPSATLASEEPPADGTGAAAQADAGDAPHTPPPNAEVWAQHPGEFVPPTADDKAAMPQELAPHTSPENFAANVNDGGNEVPGRGINCVDCARATERSWEGHPEVSAARAVNAGEPKERLTEWTGVEPQRQSFEDIGRELEQRGPGSSAVIASTWEGGGGHAYNAVNDGGTVKFVDSQPEGGAVGTWPPTRDSPGYGFDESDTRETWAWYMP